MLKKTITYLNFNGEEVKEDLYFNLTQAEILEMDMQVYGGYASMLQKIVDAKNPKEIVQTFKRFILDSYGEKSDDGKHFMKSDEIRQKFACSQAYSVLFVELISDAKNAAAFVNGVMPQDLNLGK